MAKNSVIISVSIPKDQAEWLDMVELSPSEILQSAIYTKMEMWNQYNQEKAKLIGNIEGLQKILAERITYLEEKGLVDEFVKWRGEKYG